MTAGRREDIRLYLRQQPVMVAPLALLAVIIFLAVTGCRARQHAEREALGNRWFSRGASRIATRGCLPVRRNPSGWSSVSKQQLRTMANEGKRETSLGSLLPSGRIPELHPDNPLETARWYVNRWPLVPVVSRGDFRRLEGVISQRDALERYREFGEG